MFAFYFSLICFCGGGLVAKSCPTLATLWTVACQPPLSMGFSGEEYWSGLPFPTPGDLPNPGIKPESLVSLGLACRFFTIYVTGSPLFPSLLRFLSVQSVMPPNHLILCCRLLFPSIFPSIRVFSSEKALHSGWPTYWSFNISISPSREYSD